MVYSLSHSYYGDDFASQFNFFDGVDPSNGFIRYAFTIKPHLTTRARITRVVLTSQRYQSEPEDRKSVV